MRTNIKMSKKVMIYSNEHHDYGVDLDAHYNLIRILHIKCNMLHVMTEK